ncbi:MAG: DUF1285 domain-containing protein [Pseudomonadota bacterium]
MTDKKPTPKHSATLTQKIGNPLPFGESHDLGALPPVHDFDFRIDRQGEWYYRGSLIKRKALVKLFSTILKRDDHGVYWLQTPVEKAKVHVEDAPFTAVEFFVREEDGRQVAGFRTNLDHHVELGPDHPLRLGSGPRDGEPRPYVLIRPRLEALVTRPAYYQMANAAIEERFEGRQTFGIRSQGMFFPLD